MDRAARANAIVTPEAVALDLDTAGIGSRMIALMIDHAIQGALALLFLLPVNLIGSGTAAMVTYVVILFVLLWGYFPIFEGVWNGRTPGKAAQRLRVVQIDGQPVTMGAVILRNVLRIIDFLPGFYAAGTIAMLMNPRAQRLGDMAAGTIVIRERKSPESEAARYAGPLPGEAPVDATGINEREYGLVRGFLQRRDTLDPPARADLAVQIASTIRVRLNTERLPGEDDERFLEKVAHSYRERFAPPPQEQGPPAL